MRPKTKGLTPGEQNALDIYSRYIEAWGDPPSAQQLGAELGITRQKAHDYIIRLRTKGYLSSPTVTIIRPTLTRKAKRTS